MSIFRIGKRWFRMRHIILLLVKGCGLPKVRLSLPSTLFEESLSMWRRLDNPGRIGQALVGLAMVRRFEGDAASARRLIEEARAILERLGYRYWVAVTSMQLGHVAALEGDDRQALAHYADSLARAIDLGANEMMVENIEFLACVATRLGRPLRAGTLFGAAAALRAQFELPPAMATEAGALDSGTSCARSGHSPRSST
jgi:hypothetical protein